MSTITLPNIRVSSDLTVKVRLTDDGVAIDWTTLSRVRATIYSDAQRALAGRCDVSVDAEDPTLLVCQYAATKPQYVGVNRIVVSATYMGEMKTYDKPAFTFVRWTADQEGEEITIDDPDVDVEITVEDISSSILQEAVDAAFTAADRANDAAAAAEHMVDIHTGPQGKSAYEVAVDEGYVGTEEEWLASLVGPQGQQGIQGETGDAAGFGAVTASVDSTTGTPSVAVTASGPDTAKAFDFAFSGLKGEKGDKGDQGNTGSSVDYPYELVNNLTTDDATKGLSAAMGVALEGEVSQLEAKVYGDSSHEILDTTSPVAGTLASGQWKTNGSYGYWLNAVLPVSGYRGRTLRITPKSAADSTTYFFAKDNVLVHNENVNLCDGWSTAASTADILDITIPNDAGYLVVRLTNTNTSADKIPQSLLVLAQEGDLDKKVDKVVGKGLSTNDYTDADKAKVATIPNAFVVPSDLNNYVPKEQGIENAGLLLKVGTDGKVTLGTGGGVGPDVIDCVRKEISRTLFLGENVLSGVVGVGTGWTENSGNYTHETGEASTLEFPLATDSGDAYVAILSYSVTGQNEEAVVVSIGDGVPCDIYNGTLGPFYVGMVSDGGNLKITAESVYAGTISGVELRKVVPEEDAVISITLDTTNNKHYENVESGTMRANLTGWWNVAMGANDALEANQNGSRNIAIGARSLVSMHGGTRNIGVGTFSLHRLLYGARNIAIGADSAWYITGGYDNIALGKAAFGEIRGDNPQRNVAIGTSALSIATSTNPEDNVAIGYRALSGGANASQKTNCVAIGASAGLSNNTKCVAIGANAAFYIKGQGNVAIGFDAMNYYNVDGQNNVCIGHLARLYPPSRPATIDNAIAIGYNAKATKSNQVVIGNANNDEFVLGGKKLVFNQDGTISWTAA